jgi:hypothetical protein
LRSTPRSAHWGAGGSPTWWKAAAPAPASSPRGRIERAEVLNDVTLDQVLVRFHAGSAAGDGGPAADDDVTQRVVAAVQRSGECWMSGTTWRGRAAMRISVVNWQTTEADVDRSVAAIERALASA